MNVDFNSRHVVSYSPSNALRFGKPLPERARQPGADIEQLKRDLFGTFIETGTGMIHAFNERVASAMTSIGRSMPNYWRAITAALLLTGAMMMSRFGIIDLIAVGYGAISWAFIIILIIPLLTVGIWKVVRGG